MPVNDLPVQLTSFIGREQEVARLTKLLADARLVTLTGPGGAGKTRTAVEAARGWEGGEAVFVELAPIVDQALIPNAIAVALGVAEVAREPLLDAIVRSLKSRRVLLVLDNCEHLVVGCSVFVEQLLRACPTLTVLATSREPLNAAGEVVQRLAPLEPPEAAALFVERAIAAEPGFAGRSRNAALLESICRQLDGLPLAIELAAPYVRMLSLKELAEELEQRFELLQARRPAAAARHQTLRALVDWSYELLAADEQRLFRKLSVFAGGCTLEAIAGICVDDGPSAGALLPLLGGLIEKSLVVAEEQQDGETRYRMLETLRQHSRDRLREAGEEPKLRQRHLDWFLALVEQGVQGVIGLRGPHQVRWQRRIEHETENCRIALVWSRVAPGQRDAGLKLAAALGRRWHVRGHAGEAFDWLMTLLDEAPADVARARALEAAGWIALRRGHPDPQPFLDEALSLARALGERLVIVAALEDLAQLRLQRGDAASSRTASEEALSLVQTPDVAHCRYTPLWLLGRALAAMDQRETAVAHLREAVRLASEHDDVYISSLVLRDLGTLLLELGELTEARACLADALHAETRPVDAMQVLARFVGLALAEGDVTGAVRLGGAVGRLTEAWPERLTPEPLRRWEQTLEAAAAALGPALAEAARTEGAAMSLDEAIASALRSGPQARAPSERPGGLTPRELEVARLLVDGLTNRQVAAVLVLSERTVGRHVENILGKLGLTNRAQVAAWAVERGLAQPLAR